MVAKKLHISMPHDRTVKNGTVECEIFLEEDLHAMHLQPLSELIGFSCYDSNLDALCNQVKQACHNLRVSAGLDSGADYNNATFHFCETAQDMREE